VPDREPNAFTVSTVEDAELATEYSTLSFTVSGVNEAVTLSVSGCTYLLNEGPSYSDESVQVNNGDSVKFRVVSVNEVNSSQVCSIQVGTYQTDYRVTTKQHRGSIAFYYHPKLGIVNPVEAQLSKFYIHDVDGSNVEEVSTFEGNVATYIRPLPFSFSAVFEGSREGQEAVVIQTIHGYDGEMDEYYVRDVLPVSAGDVMSSACKTLTIDRTQLQGDPAYVSEDSWVGASTPYFCGSELSSSTTWTSLDIDLHGDDSENIANDLLVYVQADNNNLLGYDFLTSADYSGGETIVLNNLKTDFVQIPVVNTIAEPSNIKVRGFPQSNQDFSYPLGSYDLEASEVDGLMNVITAPMEKYSINQSQFNGDNSTGYRSTTRRVYREVLPDIFDIEEQHGQLTHVEAILFDDYEISWQSEGLEYFINSSVILAAETSSGKALHWSIYTQNTGAVFFPDLDVLENLVFEYNSSISIFLYPSGSSEDEYRSATAYIPVSCDVSYCRVSTDF